MFNLKKNCSIGVSDTESVHFDEILKFYIILLKYKNLHPFFNLKGVMFKLYPNLNWEQIISKTILQN